MTGAKKHTLFIILPPALAMIASHDFRVPLSSPTFAFPSRVDWETAGDAELVLAANQRDCTGKEAFVEIVRLAWNEAVRREPGERGWRHVAEHFSLERMVRCYRSIFCQDRRESWPSERNGL